MTKDKLKDLVKSYFSLTEKMTEDNTTEPIKFAEATLADGTKISNKKDAEFAVGDKLYVIIDGGEDVIAPEGEHTTESGITVTVNEAGDITGIKRPDESGEGSLEDFSKETKTEEVDATELAEHDEEIIIEEEGMNEHYDRGEIIEAIMEEMAPKIEDLEKKMSSCMDRLAEHDEKMKEYMSEPAKTPAMEKKFSTNKVEDVSNSNMSAANKRAYRRLLNKTKN
jgi:hypothetical protein